MNNVRINVSDDGTVEVVSDAHKTRTWQTARNNAAQGSQIACFVLDVLKAAKDHPRFSFDVDAENVFFYVDDQEVVWWWTGDRSHHYQGAEIADDINRLLEHGVEKAFLADDSQKSRWFDKKP